MAGSKYFVFFLAYFTTIWKKSCGYGTILPATCEDIYHTVSTSSGVYSLTSGSHTFKAFCQFNEDSTGYFFPSLEAVQFNDTFELNIQEQFSERNEILVRVIQDDGNQLDAKQEELQQFSGRNLTVMLNYCELAGCLFYANVPYLFVNFLHPSTISRGSTNGLRSNGQDIAFSNSDSNPNSQIIFAASDIASPKGSGNFNLMTQWRGTFIPTSPEDMIPVGEANNFKFTVEHHFGGGGAYQLSRDWSTYTVNPLASTGAAIGLKFKINNSCQGNHICGVHSDCVDTITSYYCRCHKGFGEPHCNFVVEYMGCFKDMEERAMTGTNIVSDSQDITACARECIQQGHNYLGLQNGKTCYCGEEYDRYGRADTDDECNMPCTGSNDQICGGGYRNSIYKVIELVSCSVPSCISCDSNNPHHCLVCEGELLAINGTCREADSVYVGCFSDKSDHLSDRFYITSVSHSSAQYCIDICFRFLYRYAWLENGTGCICSNKNVNYGRTHDSICNTTYNSNQDDRSNWHIAVYSLYAKGQTKRYSRNEGITSVGDTPVISVQSNIGVIDCLRIAFSKDYAESFTYELETKMCHIYSNGDGMFQKNANYVL